MVFPGRSASIRAKQSQPERVVNDGHITRRFSSTHNLAIVLMIFAFTKTNDKPPGSDFPTICVPVSSDDPVWIALQTGLSFVFRYIPFDAFSSTRHCRLGWEFHDRFRTHE